MAKALKEPGSGGRTLTPREGHRGAWRLQSLLRTSKVLAFLVYLRLLAPSLPQVMDKASLIM